MISREFDFYVGKNAGLVSEVDFRTGWNAGFYHFDDAIKWAEIVCDGLNFVMVYNSRGKTVKSFSPGNKG